MGIDSVSGPSPTTKARSRWQGVDNPRTGGNGKAEGWDGGGNPTRRIPIISPFCQDCRSNGGWGGGRGKRKAEVRCIPRSIFAVITSPRTDASSRRFDSQNRHARVDIKTPNGSPLLPEFLETGDFNRRNSPLPRFRTLLLLQHGTKFFEFHGIH